MARAQINDKLPPELEKVKVTQNLKAQIPLDLEFLDSKGKKVALKELFDDRLPTILTMNYSACPMLCSRQLNTMLDAIKKMPWSIGKEYQIVTVSIDPTETTDRAQQTKQKYLQDYGREGAGGGWHFLTSRKEQNIEKLAETVGFGYAYDPKTKQYAHPTPLIVCTPTGRVSRYLDMKQYDPQTIKFSLLEAGEGKVGTFADQFFLSCFHYDPEKGRYAPQAIFFMQLGGGISVVILGSVLFRYWIRDAKQEKTPQNS
ncbi:MAG: SCO family protein [Pirellulales bacterium]|nr:SCO family protein [Pirellulales bacterium]